MDIWPASLEGDFEKKWQKDEQRLNSNRASKKASAYEREDLAPVLLLCNGKKKKKKKPRASFLSHLRFSCILSQTALFEQDASFQVSLGIHN